jgi:hypothetical protein
MNTTGAMGARYRVQVDGASREQLKTWADDSLCLNQYDARQELDKLIRAEAAVKEPAKPVDETQAAILSTLRSIRGMLMFFTILTVIGIVVGFLAGLFKGL